MPNATNDQGEITHYVDAKVRAKMYLTSIGRTNYGGNVKLQVVCRGKDNAEWAAATPSGNLELTIKNEVALAFFQDPGDEFYVDIVRIPKNQFLQAGMDLAIE